MKTANCSSVVPHMKAIWVVIFAPIFYGVFRQNRSNIFTNGMTAGLNRLLLAAGGPKVNSPLKTLIKVCAEFLEALTAIFVFFN